MIYKLATVGTVFAFMLAGSGCDQTSPPAAVQSSRPAAATTPATSAETQAAAPADPARSPGPAEATGRQVGEALDDATITTKVKSALLQAPDVKGLDVKVETDKSVVQLSGFVANQAQIDKAMELAKGVQGVREVQNKMSVKPS
jgi:osmotically-inducible protein OsmY